GDRHQQEIVVGTHPVIAVRRRPQAVVAVVAHDVARAVIAVAAHPARVPVMRVGGTVAVAAIVMSVVGTTIMMAFVAMAAVAAVIGVASFDMAAIRAVVALAMLLAAAVVVTAIGQRHAAGAEQSKGDEQATEAFHPAFLRGRGRDAAAWFLRDHRKKLHLNTVRTRRCGFSFCSACLSAASSPAPSSPQGSSIAHSAAGRPCRRAVAPRRGSTATDSGALRR